MHNGSTYTYVMLTCLCVIDRQLPNSKEVQLTAPDEVEVCKLLYSSIKKLPLYDTQRMVIDKIILYGVPLFYKIKKIDHFLTRRIL